MDTFFDAVTGTLQGKDAGVKNTSNAVNAVIPLISGSVQYVFTNPLESLTVNAVGNSPFESEVFFSAAPGGISVSFPATLDVAGEMKFEAGCRYVMRFKSNVVSLAEISNAAEEMSYLATPHNLTSNTSDPRFTLSSSGDQYEDCYDDVTGDWSYIYHQAWNAMDNDSGNIAAVTSDNNYNWWQIRFNEGLMDLHSVYIEEANMQMVLEGSFDGADFTEIRTIPVGTGKYKINASPYRYYRLRNSNTNSYASLSFREIEFKYRQNTSFVKLDAQSFKITDYITSFPIEAYGTGLTYEATGLPAGLNINSQTGEVSGTFPKSGTFTFQVKVTNPAGDSKTAQMSVEYLPITSDDVTVFEVTTEQENQEFNITSVRGNVLILWGDGTSTEGTTTGTAGYSHTYKKTGVYKVVLTGAYTALALGVWIPGGEHPGKYITAVLKVSNNLTDAVASLTPMFGGLERITSMPLFNTSNFTCFEHMFLGCKELLTAPQFNTSNVTSFKQVFDGCSKLTAIPAWDFSKSTSFDRSFQYCSNLTGTANAASFWGNTKVRSYSSCFRNCTKLSNYASIPSGWK